MQMRKASLAIALASLLLLSGCFGAADDGPPDIFNGDDIYPVQAVPDFSLLDHEGNGFNISDHDGQVIVIVFMFTRCPDVCPVVSSNTRWVTQQMQDHIGSNLTFLSVTVDPWTDDAATLSEYRDDLELDWLHLTGAIEQLETVWGAFDVGVKAYTTDSDQDGVADAFDLCPTTPEGEQPDEDGCGESEQGGEDGGTEGRAGTSARHHPLDYWVDHTTGTVMIDKNMQQRVWWGDTDWVPELFLDDLEILLAEE